jgi:hypothetical protein
MSRPVGIAAMVLGFALFWPVGLAVLAFMVASGRLGCRGRRWAQGPQGPWAQGYWGTSGGQGGQQPGQGGQQPRGSNEWSSNMSSWSKWCGGARTAETPSSGNHAFDEYRAETLRRLEEEQTEFSSFLERLRFAKDKAEFDQFMAERRQAPPSPPAADDRPHG